MVRNGKKDSELEIELKACVHIKMMFSNLVEATFLWLLGIRNPRNVDNAFS